MTLTVLPDATPIGELLARLVQANPYSGAPYVIHGGRPLGPAEVRLELFDPVNNLNPAALAQMEVWERSIVQLLIALLKQHGANVVLISDVLPPRHLSVDALQYVPFSRLALGIFVGIDHRVAAFREYDGASIYVPDSFARKTARSIIKPARVGRPEHKGKAWYRAQGFKRRDRTIKQLQGEMSADGIKPPSKASIRAWEVEAEKLKYRQKPGA
jgi:hypothetical protein